MIRHKHLSSLPPYLKDMESRIMRPDLSQEYIQGLVDGSLLAYSQVGACKQCRKAFSTLNSRVDSLESFLEAGLGGCQGS